MISSSLGTPYPLFGHADAQTLTAEGATYVAKLKRGGRPKTLIYAFLALLRTYHQAAHFLAHGPTMLLRLDAQRLAAAIAAYTAASFHTPVPESAPLAQDLEVHLGTYGARARAEMPDDPQALATRLTLIVIAETQLATVAATRAAVATLPPSATITRASQSGAPCSRCLELSGTYSAPYPDDLYWTHPNCCCSWSSGA